MTCVYRFNTTYKERLLSEILCLDGQSVAQQAYSDVPARCDGAETHGMLCRCISEP